MKFKYVGAFCLVFCLLTTFLSSSLLDKMLFGGGYGDDNLSKEERGAGQILDETSFLIAKKYKIDACGTNVSMPSSNVRKLGLVFQSEKKLSRGELRNLMVDFGELLLQNINANEDIQPFLVKRPFTIENVEIIIYNKDRGRDLYDPEIAMAHLACGEILYRTNDPENELRFKNRFDESFEEAKKLLQSQ